MIFSKFYFLHEISKVLLARIENVITSLTFPRFFAARGLIFEEKYIFGKFLLENLIGPAICFQKSYVLQASVYRDVCPDLCIWPVGPVDASRGLIFHGAVAAGGLWVPELKGLLHNMFPAHI